MNKLLSLFVTLVLVTSAYAESLTATVISYDKAEMSGDVVDGMWVDFYNTYHSKGQVTANNEAILTIGGWQICEISRVTLWMKSNKSSGAATVRVWVNDKVEVNVRGTFKELNGTYSTDYVPISFDELSYNIKRDDIVKLQLIGEENSVYIDRAEIRYVIPPPCPHSITFRWFTDMQRDTLMTESQTGGGIVLPNVDADSKLLMEKEGWVFDGWSKWYVESTISEEDILPVGMQYFPEWDELMYGVWRRAGERYRIAPSSLGQDGVYALVQPWMTIDGDSVYIMAKGAVENGMIQTDIAQVEWSEDVQYLVTDYLPDTYRYQLTWNERGDSLRIRSLDSNSWIGHSSTSLNSSSAIWQVGMNEENMFLYYGLKDGEKAYILSPNFWQNEEQEWVIVMQSMYTLLPSIQQGLYLFDVSNIPLSGTEVEYCSNPLHVENAIQLPISPTYDPCEKILMNGSLYIRCGENIVSPEGKIIK